MKVRIFALIAAAALACCMLASCGGKSDPIGEVLDRDEIESVTMTSTMSKDATLSIEIDEAHWNKVIDQLKSYKLKYKGENEKKGWALYFKFELKSGELVQISISDDDIIIGNDRYQMENYDSHDFDYLFEAG